MVNNKNGNRGINKSITEQNNIKNASKYSTINKRKLMVDFTYYAYCNIFYSL